MTTRIIATVDNSIYYPQLYIPHHQVLGSGDKLICKCTDENQQIVTVEAYITMKELKQIADKYDWILSLYCERVFIYSSDPYVSARKLVAE